MVGEGSAGLVGGGNVCVTCVDSSQIGISQPPRHTSMSHLRKTCVLSGNLKAWIALYKINVAPVSPVEVVRSHVPKSFGLRVQPYLSESWIRPVLRAS